MPLSWSTSEFSCEKGTSLRLSPKQVNNMLVSRLGHGRNQIKMRELSSTSVPLKGVTNMSEQDKGPWRKVTQLAPSLPPPPAEKHSSKDTWQRGSKASPAQMQPLVQAHTALPGAPANKSCTSTNRSAQWS